MIKEILSKRQATCLIALFIFGESMIFGGYSFNNTGSWVSMLLAIIFAIPIYLIYVYILKKNPQKDIFEISDDLFGKFFSKIIILFFVGAGILVTVIAFKNLGLFMNILSFPETPLLFLLTSVAIVAFLMIRHGIEILGRGSCVILPIIIVTSIITALLLSYSMDINNLRPLVSEPINNVFKGAMCNLSVTFIDVFLFLGVIISAKKSDILKTFLTGLLIGGALFLVVIITSHGILSSPLVDVIYYPSYVTLSVIDFGQFLTRIEVIISSTLTSTLIIKACLGIYVASKGIAKLTSTKQYNKLYLPVTIIALVLSFLLFKSLDLMIKFRYHFCLYKLVIQVGLPLLIALVIFIKDRKRKKISKTFTYKGYDDNIET